MQEGPLQRYRQMVLARELSGGLAGPLDRLMGFRHELLEVHAPLRRVVDRLEEEIEQHGLAAANPAIEVEPFGRRAAARKWKQIAEPRHAVLRETVGEQLQLFGGKFLRVSGAALLCFDEREVTDIADAPTNRGLT